MAIKDELNKLANNNQYKIKEMNKRKYEEIELEYKQKILPSLKDHALAGRYHAYVNISSKQEDYIKYLMEILEKDDFKVERQKGFIKVEWN